MIETEKDKRIIEHIRSHCNKISKTKERFGSELSVFESDSDYIDSVLMNLSQIGELAKLLSEDYVRSTSSSIPWKQIRGLRNVIIHDYNNVETESIWNTITDDIPRLKEFCDAELGS